MMDDQFDDQIFKRKVLYRDELKHYLASWPWEWFASLNLGGSSINAASAERALKKWRISLGILLQLQIATMGVLNQYPSPHIHLFLLGRNKRGDTLHSNFPGMWALRWHADAKIEKIYSNAGVIGYVVDRNMPEGQCELLAPYGLKLLKKLMLT